MSQSHQRNQRSMQDSQDLFLASLSSDVELHSGFSSAYDFIERSRSATAIDSGDYPSAASLQASFVASLPSATLISFEADNGWLDVDGSYSSGFVADDHQFLAGLFSPYSSFSPATTGADGRTTLVPTVSAGDHAFGTAAGTIEYIHADGGVFSGNRVHFNLQNIGHGIGPAEPDLARVHSQANIDRGINTTIGTDAVAGGRYDQFLEVIPSEQDEGGLNVYFLGEDAATGDAFSNPVTAFGFYLMGREIKRDVYLNVYNTDGDLIHSAPTVEPGDVAEAAVEYISFALDPEVDSAAIASFSLWENYVSSDGPGERDIFAIDDLVVQFGDDDATTSDGSGSTDVVHSGFESAYDYVDRSTPALSIASDDYPSSYDFQEQFIASLSDDILITFEADNGWLDVDGSYASGFVADDHQLLAGLSSPYSIFSPAAIGADGRTTLITGVAAGDHANGTADGTIEYIHADGGSFDGHRIHFNLDNIGHLAGPDEPDLARVNSFSNIDRGINMTAGVDAVAGGSYDQFLEVLPSEQAEGGLNVYFSGKDAASGDAFANPVTAFGFYLMGREIKRDVYLDVYNADGDLIHSAPTSEPGSLDEAVVEYISFSLDPAVDASPIQSFSLREEFGAADDSSRRDIFSIDNLSLQFADLDASLTSTPVPTPTPAPSPAPTPSGTSVPEPTPDPTPAPDLESVTSSESNSEVASFEPAPPDFTEFQPGDLAELTTEAVSELTADQIADLTPAAIQGFTAVQVAELSDRAVAEFTPQQVNQLSTEAVVGLSRSQVSELTPKAVKGFTSEQMEELPRSTFKALETVQLAKLSKDAVTGLTSGQLKTLTGEEIAAFKPGKIKSLDADAISGLKPSTLDDFSRRQVKALSDDQMTGLSKRQIKKADDFVDALSNQQRDALSFDPGRSNRLVDPLADQDDLSLLPGLDPLA